MDQPTPDTQLEFAVGAIMEIQPDLTCRIRLDDGRVVAAMIFHFIAREMFRIAPSDRVEVIVMEQGYSVVSGFERVTRR